MTIEELRAAIALTQEKVNTLALQTRALQTFIGDIALAVSEDNPFAPTIDADALAALQLPLYNQHKANIDAARIELP